jgi:hypothetical protein
MILHDAERAQKAQEPRALTFAQPSPAFIHDKKIADFEPLQRRGNRILIQQMVSSKVGDRMVLIPECPTGGDRSVQTEGHQKRRPSSRAGRISSTVMPSA